MFVENLDFEGVAQCRPVATFHVFNDVFIAKVKNINKNKQNDKNRRKKPVPHQKSCYVIGICQQRHNKKANKRYNYDDIQGDY